MTVLLGGRVVRTVNMSRKSNYTLEKLRLVLAGGPLICVWLKSSLQTGSSCALWPYLHLYISPWNPVRPLNDVSPASLRLVFTASVYTRSFSGWSMYRAYTPPPPPVSEMAVKSMGTNEIKLLGGSEEQMIFLWLITHCKCVCAGCITSESVSLPRFPRGKNRRIKMW